MSDDPSLPSDLPTGDDPGAWIDWTTVEQSRASHPGQSAWVSANAGSGKTHVLTQRVIRLLLAGARPPPSCASPIQRRRLRKCPTVSSTDWPNGQHWMTPNLPSA